MPKTIKERLEELKDAGLSVEQALLKENVPQQTAEIKSQDPDYRGVLKNRNDDKHPVPPSTPVPKARSPKIYASRIIDPNSREK